MRKLFSIQIYTDLNGQAATLNVDELDRMVNRQHSSGSKQVHRYPEPPGDAPYFTYTWDGLGRITKIIHPGQLSGIDRATVETKAWHSWGELISKEYFNGVSARTTSCREIVRRGELVFGIADELACNSSEPAHNFQRDDDGNLQAIWLAGETNPRQFTFDGFGRMQAQVIPGVGSYYFTYDIWGNLNYRFQFDKNGVFVSGLKFEYDALNRLTKSTTMALSNGNLLEDQLVESRRYDSYSSGNVQIGNLATPKGSLTEVQAIDTAKQGYDHSERLEYNRRAELVYRSIALGAEQGFFEKYTRTLDGVVRSIVNHLGVEAEYGMTASMKMRSVRMRLDGQWNSIISDVSYNGKGQLERIDYHDAGAFTSLEYDPTTLRLTRILSESSKTLDGGSRVLQDLSLTYNGNSSIVTIGDQLGNTAWGHVNRSASFSYNKRDELVGMSRYQDSRIYSYNAAGSFVRNDDIFLDAPIEERGDLSQAEAAETSLIPRGTVDNPYNFDAAGRLYSRNGIVSTEYDHNNRLIKLTTSNQVIYYGYNHEGQRTYKKIVDQSDANTNVSLYPLKTFHREPSGVHSFVYMGDQRLARVEHNNDNRWYYYLKDHIGSSDIMMTGGNMGVESDLPVEQMLYRAYGSEYDPATLADDLGGGDAWSSQVQSRKDAGVYPSEKTHHRFTGHYLDDESGLYYFGARYYDPGNGRFISADRLFIDSPELCIERPLECNLYGYANNNPIKHIDKNGNFVCGGACVLGAAFAVGAVTSAVATVIDDTNWFKKDITGSTLAKAAVSGLAGGIKGAGAITAFATGGAGLGAYAELVAGANFVEKSVNTLIDVGSGKTTRGNFSFGEWAVDLGASTVVDTFGGKLLSSSVAKNSGLMKDFATEIGKGLGVSQKAAKTMAAPLVGGVGGFTKAVAKDTLKASVTETVKATLKVELDGK